jgi:hypothetical protein
LLASRRREAAVRITGEEMSAQRSPYLTEILRLPCDAHRRTTAVLLRPVVTTSTQQFVKPGILRTRVFYQSAAWPRVSQSMVNNPDHDVTGSLTVSNAKRSQAHHTGTLQPCSACSACPQGQSWHPVAQSRRVVVFITGYPGHPLYQKQLKEPKSKLRRWSSTWHDAFPHLRMAGAALLHATANKPFGMLYIKTRSEYVPLAPNPIIRAVICSETRNLGK